MKNLELQKRANDVRKGIVTAVHGAKAGHPGGSLSAADIFTFLYFEEMNIDPKNPDMEERDRFVLSKGHTAPGLYSALAYRGYFPVEDLPTLGHDETQDVGSGVTGNVQRAHTVRARVAGLQHWQADWPRQRADRRLRDELEILATQLTFVPRL